MSKIYVELPITTNQTTISVPCGEDILWHFTIIFNENECLRQRLVTVMDIMDGNDKPEIQSMLISKDNNRTASFKYHRDGIIASIELTVYYCRGCKIIMAEW